MSRNLRFFIVSLGALAAVILAVIGVFALDRALHTDKILHNVYAGATDLSGTNKVDAQLLLLEDEDNLVSQPALFDVGSTTVELQPDSIGFELDKAGITQEAFEAGRQGTILDQFGWWLRHVLAKKTIPLRGSIDSDSLGLVFDYWDETAFTTHPFNGAVEIQDGRAVAHYPTDGVGIDRTPAAQIVLDTLLDSRRPVGALPTADVRPTLTHDDIDAAVAEAQDMIGSPIVLTRTNPDLSVTFTPADLASAFRSTVVSGSPARIQLSFDPDTVAEILAPQAKDLGVAPKDADFRVVDDKVEIIPSQPGEIVDPALTAQQLVVASELPDRTGALPYEDAAEPDFTTADAEALNITHLVSRFTTYYSCCQNRVTNIHLMADIIDGAVVLPGDEFSINEYVGERDTARGFLPDHTIILGEFVDTIGGGVSQFATTFYNAVFYGGYEDVTHKPHTYYFTRYPEGHEATISWPAPNLIFRNDSDSGVLIKTSYTDTSLTVSFYGDNGGRTMVGEQKGGKTYAEVTSEGDDTARKVTASVSGRFDQLDPPTEYVPDETLLPGEENVVQKGTIGWTVLVTRDIEYPDGHVESRTWTVRYRPEPHKVEVNPCMIPPEEGEEPVPCPTTTTLTGSTDTTGTTATTAP
jgi:vancomycin resistance protein YoaR